MTGLGFEIQAQFVIGVRRGIWGGGVAGEAVGSLSESWSLLG